MKDDILGNFAGLDLHDAPLQKIELLAEKNELRIHLLDFDDLHRKYVPIIVVLKGLCDFRSHYPPEQEFRPGGCLKAQCKALGEEKYQVDFVFELGKYSVWMLSAGFTGLQIEGGLSPEAAAFRERLMES